MKNVCKMRAVFLIISYLLLQVGFGESDMQHCSNRDDLELLTGVPATGIQIERIDQIAYSDFNTTLVIAICTENEKGAMDFFFEGNDHTVFHDPKLINLDVPFFEELLSSYGITRAMLQTSTDAVLEMAVDGMVIAYGNYCFSYNQGQNQYFIVISFIPCMITIDSEAILSIINTGGCSDDWK